MKALRRRETRVGLAAALLAWSCIAIPAVQAETMIPKPANSSAPIILADEAQMNRCTNQCDRAYRRCGKSRHCRNEHNACIRDCV